MAEKYLVRINDDASTFAIRHEPEGTFVSSDDGATWREVDLDRIGDSDLYLLMVDNHPMELYLERRRGGARVTIGRHAFDVDIQRWRPGVGPRSRAAAQAQGMVRVTAPMTGSVVEVRCGVGMEARSGDVLLVIESMKMNNEVRAPADGVVESVSVGAGQRIRAGDVLVVLHSNGGARARDGG